MHAGTTTPTNMSSIAEQKEQRAQKKRNTEYDNAALDAVKRQRCSSSSKKNKAEKQQRVVASVAAAISDAERSALVLAWSKKAPCTGYENTQLLAVCNACGQSKERHQDDCYLCVACEDVLVSIANSRK